MFSRLSAILLVVPLLVSATAIPRGGGQSVSQCDTGPVQCCNSLQDATDPQVASALGLLGLILGPITGQVGLTCNPISALGVGGNNCASQPVCCTNTSFNGLINLGCSPLNVNL
ncbi:hypothetical protein AX17_003142 [Amanita inopinata Kibby_2008]|nr:hypothetical protein AX17_003142 [Amanita inopinata Kibby_2008]